MSRTSKNWLKLILTRAQCLSILKLIHCHQLQLLHILINDVNPSLLRTSRRKCNAARDVTGLCTFIMYWRCSRASSKLRAHHPLRLGWASASLSKLGWVWFGGVCGYSHPTQQPRPTQTQPTCAHSEDAHVNSLAMQGYRKPYHMVLAFRAENPSKALYYVQTASYLP